MQGQLHSQQVAGGRHRRPGVVYLLQAVLYVACTALVASACSPPAYAPKPMPSGKPLPSQEVTSAIPVPKVLPSTAPLNLTKPDRQAAIRFVQKYIAAETKALRTGDTKPLGLFAASTCGACLHLTRSIQAIYADGGKVKKGFGRTVEDIDAVRNTGMTGVTPLVVGVEVSFTAQIQLSKSGRVKNRLPSGKAFLQYQLRKTDKSWQVVSIQTSPVGGGPPAGSG